MGWWHNRYKSRPAAKNKGARVAWDVLSCEAAEMTPPRTIQTLWYAGEMEAWCAHLNDLENDKERYIEMDALEVRDRVNNPHKYSANDERAMAKSCE